MGITVRHDPSPASMFRVARRAAESDVAEQRRQEALRQQQINAELAARKAAQDVRFALFGDAPFDQPGVPQPLHAAQRRGG